MNPLPFVLDDGGRGEAGFRGTTGDCATRALTLVSGRPYREVYDLINRWAKTERRGKRKKGVSNARTGVYQATMRRMVAAEFPEAVWVPTMGIGTGTTMHLRVGELPSGRVLASVSKHFTAVLDGVVHDTHDPTRDGNRCVYGFWIFP